VGFSFPLSFFACSGAELVLIRESHLLIESLVQEDVLLL